MSLDARFRHLRPIMTSPSACLSSCSTSIGVMIKAPTAHLSLIGGGAEHYCLAELRKSSVATGMC